MNADILSATEAMEDDPAETPNLSNETISRIAEIILTPAPDQKPFAEMSGIKFFANDAVPPGQAFMSSPCDCPPQIKSEPLHFIKRHVVLIKGLE